MLVALVLLPAHFGQAQEAWEYSPYRIHVWVATNQSPLLGDDFLARFEDSARARARVLAGATWQLSIEPAPALWRAPICEQLDEFTEQMLFDAEIKLDDFDKLLMVGVRASPSEYRVWTRELDVATRVLSPVRQRTVRQHEMLASAVFDTAAAAFTPLARIEHVEGDKAQLRLRAGGLIVDDYCPSAIQPGDVMSAVVRQNDRYGNPRPGGVRMLDWTLLAVNQVDGALLGAQIHSINRAYLGGRVSSRVQRFALGLHRVADVTEVEVLTKTDPPEPLVGYAIYGKDPDTEETRLIGYTDWRGRVEVAVGEKPLEILYVRSGGALLARLPLVAGTSEVATVRLLNDETRLQAEALVRGVQATLVDLVAQRELLAARIRRSLQEGRLDDAQALVDRLRALDSLGDLRSRLERARQTVLTDNPRMQARIDTLFSQTQDQLIRYLQPNLVDTLASEVAAARQSQ